MLQFELGEAVQVHADNAAVVLLPILGVPSWEWAIFPDLPFSGEVRPRGERMLKIRR